jgi:hypothetical protein
LIKNKVDNLEYQEILDKLKQKYPDAFKEGIKNKKSLHEILIEVNEYLKDDIDSIYNKLAKKAEVDWEKQTQDDKDSIYNKLAKKAKVDWEKQAQDDKFANNKYAKSADQLSPLDYVLQKQSEEPTSFDDDLD